jgi:Tfp pilus assembly protein PilV
VAVRDERGFTILEALIAAIVLTIGLVALAELLAISVRMHMLGRGTTTATRLAQDKFEEMMKMNFTTNPQIQVNAADTLSSNVANYFDSPAPGYTRRWQVSAGPVPRLRHVTVRVVPLAVDRRSNAVVNLTMLVRRW